MMSQPRSSKDFLGMALLLEREQKEMLSDPYGGHPHRELKRKKYQALIDHYFDAAVRVEIAELEGS